MNGAIGSESKRQEAKSKKSSNIAARRRNDPWARMAIKKSDIYRALWDSCDQLRGRMDASLYKDYILTLLFVKYVSDRNGKHAALIDVPLGCLRSFSLRIEASQSRKSKSGENSA